MQMINCPDCENPQSVAYLADMLLIVDSGVQVSIIGRYGNKEPLLFHITVRMINTILKTAICEVLLLLICLFGDHLLSHPVAKQPFARAITDSMTHGLVGGISWAVVTNIQLDRQKVVEWIVCMGLAMVVDIDHFIAAKSLHLKDALSLEKRPFFHATTLIVFIDGTVLVISYVLRTRSLQVLTMMFTVAWVSHHIRDSVRRGLWFPPFGETPPLPRSLYLTVILIIPLLTRFIYNSWRAHPDQQTLQQLSLESV